MSGGPSRRETLALLVGGAASLVGCSRGERREAVPWVDAIPDVTPGEPRHVATALVQDGLATGIVATTNGRPTKIEGNPLHPSSLGATGPREQAALLGLYDVHRSHEVRHGRSAVGFRRFVEAFAPGGEAVGLDGAGVHLLLPPTSSPTTLRLLDLVRARLPGVVVHHASALLDEAAIAGARAAFGPGVDVVHDPAAVDVLASFGADPLGEGPVADVRAWAARRRDPATLLRTWAVEASTSLTGAKADRRLAVRPSRVPSVLARVAMTLLGGPIVPSLAAFAVDAHEAAFADALAADLRRAGPRVRLVVGRTSPPWAHALVHLLHARLGAAVAIRPDVRGEIGGLGPLLAAIDTGAVRTLLILGGNPAYGHPAEARVAERLRRVATVVHHGLHDDETAAVATWHVPALHDLERWGDARAADGTISVVQPTIAPLFGGRSVDEVLAALTGAGEVACRDLVRGTWIATDERSWRAALRDGVFAGTASPLGVATVDEAAVLALVAGAVPPSPTGIEAVFAPCPKVLDGRFANNAWLQELPHPITRVSWTNTATLSPATAARLELDAGDVVHVARGDVGIELPVAIDPTQADDVVAIALGYGRRSAELVADGLGADVSPLRSLAAPWSTDAITLKKVGRLDLPLVQQQLVRHDRAIARHHQPGTPSAPPKEWPQLYGRRPVHLTAEHQWGMSIDLSACIGCGACVVACQAENNIPVVGPVEVSRGRVMHWIRIDRYVEPGVGRDVFQPMPCQHCEQAPCEVVCPVYATSHSPDGLNAMVYNRCVGTRFCSDACPYKVRRFNWFRYGARSNPLEALAHNPDVSVRDRGVMEKCTFCLQRIRAGERRANLDDRPLRDGEIVTACAQACPTDAIVFGDVADDSTQVHALHVDPRAYEELGDLGTRPRVRYLAALRADLPIEGDER